MAFPRLSRLDQLKLGAGAVIAVGAGLLAAWRLPGSFARSEDRERSYFYDLSERRLYAASRSVVPPDIGIGGERDDGVRAVVVAPAGHEGDKAARKIAYLQTYTPELAARLRGASGASASARVRGDDPEVLRGTLVRAEAGDTWHAMSTPEGRAIANVWRDTPGGPWVVCRP